jgi:cytoskeleton protein RodZ
MKTVGKQLQEARLAKNWTPELAARETKIQVARLRDLEADDFSHFNNATYARGFVRTYARALGLDEYKILRQLDNKLPDDDTANIVTADGGVAYLPETAMPPRVAHRDFTGLYIVLGLGAVVALISVFVLFRAYQVGELHWTSSDTASSDAAATNAAPLAAVMPGSEAKRALPIDSNTPPPIPVAVPAATSADAAIPVAVPESQAPASAPPRALPVDPATLNASAQLPPAETAPAAPANPATATDIPAHAPRALPVDPATLNADNANPPPASAPPSDIPVNAPRALPVSPAELAANPPPAETAQPAAPVAPAPANGPVVLPPPTSPNASASSASADAPQPLVLTASRDSFVQVTPLDSGTGYKPVYSAVLHSGQSVGFTGHKFSVAVDNPSAVDIKLDGVNYGPHSDGSAPETFTVVSHVQ